MSQKSHLRKLPLYEERSFVSKDADLTAKPEVVYLCKALLERNITSEEDLKQWLKDRSELETALDQTGSLLYIDMTCHTDDPKCTQAYKDFIETVVPAVKPLDHQLNVKYLEARKKYPLDQDQYRIYDQMIQADVDLFIEENVPLQTEVQLLAQEYQSIFGAMAVTFQGQEYTLPQMSKFLLETDRSLRESAWRAASERRFQEKDKLEELFDKMLARRSKIAENAGCADYCEYQFRAYHRFDYTPEDCQKYHDVVEKIVVPIWQDILKKRQDLMKVDRLRPWDTAVDPLGRAPLKPFTKVDELVHGAKEIFQRVNNDLGQQFNDMANLALLDLDSRKGKAPGGYQSVLAEARKPFIFMNAVGVDSDVWTLLHEGGHAFHALAAAHHSLFPYRHAPMEFCEVASMGMELLGSEHLAVFYNDEDLKRANTMHFEDIVFTLLWVAAIDKFQQWIYSQPKHSQDDRAKTWLEIYERFSGQSVDWTGFEEQKKYIWHRQLHIFEVPFYYIEYGIAQLGALQLWQNSKKDRPLALNDYRKGLSLGGSRPLPEIFQTAGLKFDFSEEIIAPLMDSIKKEIQS